MLEEIYTKAIEISRGQTLGKPIEYQYEKGEYYITIRQLEEILKEFEG